MNHRAFLTQALKPRAVLVSGRPLTTDGWFALWPPGFLFRKVETKDHSHGRGAVGGAGASTRDGGGHGRGELGAHRPAGLLRLLGAVSTHATPTPFLPTEDRTVLAPTPARGTMCDL